MPSYHYVCNTCGEKSTKPDPYGDYNCVKTGCPGHLAYYVKMPPPAADDDALSDKVTMVGSLATGNWSVEEIRFVNSIPANPGKDGSPIQGQVQDSGAPVNASYRHQTKKAANISVFYQRDSGDSARIRVVGMGQHSGPDGRNTTYTVGWSTGRTTTFRF